MPFFTSVVQWLCFRQRTRPSFLWNIRHSLKDIKQESRSVQLLIKLLSFMAFAKQSGIQLYAKRQRASAIRPIASKVHFLLMV